MHSLTEVILQVDLFNNHTRFGFHLLNGGVHYQLPQKRRIRGITFVIIIILIIMIVLMILFVVVLVVMDCNNDVPKTVGRE